MKNSNITPFYVGQKVVCIKTNETGTVRKGNTYKVIAIKECVECKSVEINIGITSCFIMSQCACGYREVNCGFYVASRFSPIQEAKFKAVSFEKIMEEVELICEN